MLKFLLFTSLFMLLSCTSVQEAEIQPDTGETQAVQLEQAEKEAIGDLDASIEPSDFEFQNTDNFGELDRESAGEYSDKVQKATHCKVVPLAFVWREFAPFFNYKWSSEFREFASLFLSLWRAESNFKRPQTGVIVQPNCDKGPKVVASLKGKDLTVDLEHAQKKLDYLARHFKGCNINLADFGSLQWNSKWRLKKQIYRAQIERALAITTSYKTDQLKKISQADLASVVKFNSNALFLLAGLSLRGIHYEKAIVDYNSNPEYQEKTKRYRNEYLKILESEESCNLGEKILKPTTYKTKNLKKFLHKKK